jgi:hypothetical protein
MQKFSEHYPDHIVSDLNNLWNDFDPIGVMGDVDSPTDEYESYVLPLLGLLIHNAIISDLHDYVVKALDNMGLTLNDDVIEEFVQKVQSWFEINRSNLET